MACCEITLVLYVLWIHLFHINSTKTSSHWKLNVELGQIVYVEPTESEKSKSRTDSIIEDDVVFNILTSRPFDAHTVNVRNSSLQKCHTNSNCHQQQNQERVPNSRTPQEVLTTYLQCGDESSTSTFTTQYDDLAGILHRNSHPKFLTENDVILNVTVVDVERLEKRLRRAKQNNPNSVHVLTEAGVMWRIKGDVHSSLECFRRALSISPSDSKALLHLARLLLTLRYTGDALQLAKKSLDSHPADRNPWTQHYTMGEVLMTRGSYREAAAHFRLSLVHNPSFQLAASRAKEAEAFLEPSADNMYTLFVVLLVFVGVMFVVLTSFDVRYVESMSVNDDPLKCQRHFNRAMAMRSIKMSITSRSLKLKRSHFLK